MKKIFLLFIMPFLFSSSCKKMELENDDSGDWLKCKINGKEWEPSKNGDIMLDPIEVQLLDSGKTIFLKATSGEERLTIIKLDTLGLRTQLYSLGGSGGIGKYDNNSERDEFSTNSHYTGELFITLLDKNKKQVKGTFHYKAWISELKEEVNITDVKFNIYYTTY